MLYMFFIDDVNFFKRGKLSEKSETIVNKLREKMVNKLMKEESKNNEININGKLKPIFKYQDKELWRVGVICKKDCFSLTEEILKILLQKGYEWKIVSGSYKIKCRKRITEENPVIKETTIVEKLRLIIPDIIHNTNVTINAAFEPYISCIAIEAIAIGAK